MQVGDHDGVEDPAENQFFSASKKEAMSEGGGDKDSSKTFIEKYDDFQQRKALLTLTAFSL